MQKIILYIAQSLDGYVATADGSVAWLDPFNEVENEDYGYSKFIEGIDTVIQGSTTYNQFTHAHEGKKNYVFTHSPQKYSAKDVQFVNQDITQFVNSLDETHKHIWLVGGPKLLCSFLEAKKVDKMIIFTMPVLLNKGINLFQPTVDTTKITNTHSKQYNNGVIESHYDVKFIQ